MNPSANAGAVEPTSIEAMKTTVSAQDRMMARPRRA